MKSRLEMLKDTLRYAIEVGAAVYGWNSEQCKAVWELYVNEILRGVEELSDEDRLNVATNRFLAHFKEGSLNNFFTVEKQKNNMVI